MQAGVEVAWDLGSAVVMERKVVGLKLYLRTITGRGTSRVG